MMTTMSALMATLPIALGFGAGGESRRALGLAVVGGLVVSQCLTLYITPVIYLYLESAHQWYLRKRAKPGTDATENQPGSSVIPSRKRGNESQFPETPEPGCARPETSQSLLTSHRTRCNDTAGVGLVTTYPSGQNTAQ